MTMSQKKEISEKMVNASKTSKRLALKNKVDP
jgi:hypothetical protein